MQRTNNYPYGFWNEVYQEAIRMTKVDKSLNADAAYLIARRKIEEKYLGLFLNLKEVKP